MLSQIALPFERFPTSCALIWGLLRMTFHVVGKSATLTERFITDRANIRPLICVGSEVNSQIVFQFEGFTAGGACVWSFILTSSHVITQTVLCSKPLITYRTHIRPFTCVNSQVGSEVIFVSKCLSTSNTFV